MPKIDVDEMTERFMENLQNGFYDNMMCDERESKTTGTEYSVELCEKNETEAMKRYLRSNCFRRLKEII